MHFHKYRNWKFDHELDRYVDGDFWKTQDVWVAHCEKCGLPKFKRIKKS